MTEATDVHLNVRTVLKCVTNVAMVTGVMTQHIVTDQIAGPALVLLIIYHATKINQKLTMTNQSEQAKGLEEQPSEILIIKDLRNQIYELEVDNDNLQNELIMLKEQSQPGIKQWVSVEDSLPEDYSYMVKKSDFERTFQVLVLTDCDSIVNNSRVKMIHTGKWEWTMGIHEEQITHWQPLPEKPNSTTTTPKSDMVSRERVIEILKTEKDYHHDQGHYVAQIAIQECITKIKEI